MKFKEGDICTGTDDAGSITGPLRRVDYLDNQYNGGGYAYIGDNLYRFNELVKLKEKEMDKLKEGDVVTDNYSEMTVVTSHYVSIDADDNIKVYVMQEEDGELVPYSAFELEDEGFKLKTEVKEMTVKQISDELGYEVKVVEG